MILIHGALVSEELYLWGESPPAVPERPARRRPAKEKRRAPPPPSPFDAGADEVRAALRGAGLNITASAVDRRLAAWLPTRGERPLPSSGLVADAAEGGRTSVAPWAVAGLRL